MNILIKLLPALGGAIVFFLIGKKIGTKKADEYKIQAEENIRKAYNLAGEAQAKAAAAEKEKSLMRTAIESTKETPKRRVITGTTKEEIMEAIEEVIKESTK